MLILLERGGHTLFNMLRQSRDMILIMKTNKYWVPAPVLSKFLTFSVDKFVILLILVLIST